MAENTFQTGTDEDLLRAKLGNEGYEKWKKDDVELQAIKIADTRARLEQTQAQNRYFNAKGKFWEALAFGTSLGALIGLAWSIVEWVR